MIQSSYHAPAKDKLRFRHRRSLPLIRLAMDPNSKLNMPKTLENIGTIARNSFEDKHAPMYHVRNMMGSVKNAFLASLRMAPQDLIIPSQYRIIDTKEEMVMKPSEIEEIKARAAAGATAEAESRAAREREQERRREAFSPPKAFEVVKPANDFMTKLNLLKNKHEQWLKDTRAALKPNSFDESALRRKAFGTDSSPILGSRINNGIDDVDPFDFLKTFQKVGTVVRGSIKSGQETIQHVSDAAHSARKAFNTARFGAPRVLLPYARAPVLENDKVMFITPRFLDIEKEEPFGRDAESPMVKMGELMNAFGVSNPEAQRVQKQRIIVEKTKNPHPNKIPLLQARFSSDDDLLHPNNSSKDDGEDQYYIYAEDIDDEEEEESPKVGEAFQSLHSLKDIIGSRTITEFLDEMKKDFTKMHFTQKANEIQELKTQLTQASLVADEIKAEDDNEELKRFLNDLFADQTAKIEETANDATIPKENEANKLPDLFPTKTEEILGSKLFLPENLLKPFMNQPNLHQLNEYLRANGNLKEVKNNPNENLSNFLKMHALVAAINPQMYQDMFNETLNHNFTSTDRFSDDFFGNKTLGSTPDFEQVEGNREEIPQMRSQFDQTEPPKNEELGNDKNQRFSMHFPKKLQEPFMGKVDPKTEYYHDFGYVDDY